jgi:hypothetical protein
MGGPGAGSQALVLLEWPAFSVVAPWPCGKGAAIQHPAGSTGPRYLNKRS